MKDILESSVNEWGTGLLPPELDGPADREVLWYLGCRTGDEPEDMRLRLCASDDRHFARANAPDVDWNGNGMIDFLPLACTGGVGTCVSLNANVDASEVLAGHNDWQAVSGNFLNSPRYLDENELAVPDSLGPIGEDYDSVGTHKDDIDDPRWGG